MQPTKFMPIIKLEFLAIPFSSTFKQTTDIETEWGWTSNSQTLISEYRFPVRGTFPKGVLTALILIWIERRICLSCTQPFQPLHGA